METPDEPTGGEPEEFIQRTARETGAAVTRDPALPGWVSLTLQSPAQTVTVSVRDEPGVVETPEPLSGVCDRCGELKDDTDWFESWKGRLEICGECWSDTAMEE